MVRRKNGTEVDARIRALKADFDELQKDMRKLAESLGDAATNGVSEMAGSAQRAASDAAEQVELYAEQGVDSVRGAIREQPFAAIALSMGAGALIGSLLRR
jgi:ElaB/YqjD/DUF883 family membrane-anchored ribosome-binding protein